VSSTPRESRRVPIFWLGPIVVLSLTIGGYCALALATADLEGWSQWLRDFAKSPGGAGIAALLAATIAFGGIRR